MFGLVCASKSCLNACSFPTGGCVYMFGLVCASKSCLKACSFPTGGCALESVPVWSLKSCLNASLFPTGGCPLDFVSVWTPYLTQVALLLDLSLRAFKCRSVPCCAFNSFLPLLFEIFPLMAAMFTVACSTFFSLHCEHCLESWVLAFVT